MVEFLCYQLFLGGCGVVAAAKATSRKASSGRGNVSRAGREGAERGAHEARGAKGARAARARGGAPRGAAVTCRRGTPAVFALRRPLEGLLHPLKKKQLSLEILLINNKT